METKERTSCLCHQEFDVKSKQTELVMKKAARSIPSIILSVVVAFFPKCPICWAVYMSMFSSFGISQIPYYNWLFPLLFGFLGIHLFLLLRKKHDNGYGPFLISVVGAIILLSGRFFFAETQSYAIVGMVFILAGSLWNNFSFKQFNQISYGN